MELPLQVADLNRQVVAPNRRELLAAIVLHLGLQEDQDNLHVRTAVSRPDSQHHLPRLRVPLLGDLRAAVRVGFSLQPECLPA